MYSTRLNRIADEQRGVHCCRMRLCFYRIFAGRPACLFVCLFVRSFVCLCASIHFNDAVSKSNCIQLNDVMMTVDQGCTNFPK